MRRIITFLVMTVVATIIIAGLFLVIVCAPEPWQTRPWTVWERCAGYLLTILGWPIGVAALVSSSLPDRFTNTVYIICFILSGAFWATIIDLVWNKLKKRQTPNHTSEDIVAKRAESSR